jgi:protein TonB
LAPLPAPEAGATTTPSAGPEPAQIQAASAAAAAARTTAPLPAQSMPPAQRVAGTPEATLITLPAARYLRSNEVDDKPGLATAVTPQYPEAALRAKTGGRIVLRFLINEKGGLDELAVLEAEPAGVFDESALQAFRNARFVPGKLGGQDVRTQIDLELNYVPGERTTVRTESQMTYGLSVQQIRQGPLALPYRKPASARNLDPKN